jgi:hypothetical protein
LGTKQVHGLGRVKRRAVLAAAIAAAGLFLAACSPGDYPAALDKPTPRGDDPMTPEQLKQATDDLISDRDHLNAAAQSSAPAATPAGNTTGVASKP